MTPSKLADSIPWLRVSRVPGADIPENGHPVVVTGVDPAMELLRPLAMAEEQEVAWALLLNPAFQVRGIVEVGRGHIDSVPSHPREVFRAAVKYGATSMAFAHNHVVADRTPSPGDLGIAKRLFQGGDILGIPVLAALVIASDGSYTDITANNLSKRVRDGVEKFGASVFDGYGLDKEVEAAQKDLPPVPDGLEALLALLQGSVEAGTTPPSKGKQILRAIGKAAGMTDKQFDAMDRKARVRGKAKGKDKATESNLPDLRYEDQGSIWLFTGLTARGTTWLSRDVHSEDWQWLDGSLAVEHRYARDLLAYAERDGLEVTS